MESIFKRELPDLEKYFRTFADKALEEGTLSSKFKELIASAISITVKCEPCLEHHLTQALIKGATEREIAEMLGVTLLMVGGPASAWPRKTIERVLKNFKNKFKKNYRKY